MDFITEYGFDVPRGKSHEFQEWLRANEPKIAAETPDGWDYIGTYAVIVSTEKGSGAYRQLWRHHSYGDMDTMATSANEPSAFGQLMQEMASQFMDQERGAAESQAIYKAVVDASIWGE